MKGLDHHRYAFVVLEKNPSEVVLYHPLYTKKWLKDVRNLKLQKIQYKRDDKSKFVAEFINTQDICDEDLPEKEILEEFKQLSFRVAAMPNTLDENKYRQWFENKFFAVTELFDQVWCLVSFGSARSVILSHVQIKGVGKTLPSFSLWHPSNSGCVATLDAVTAFAHAHLANTTLPLGSCPAFGVLAYTEIPNEGLYLRSSDFLRMAQVGPNIIEQVKLELFQKLTDFHGSEQVKYWIRRLMGQVASMVYLSANFQGNPDNFLINGHPLDEEDWIWPQDLDRWSFGVDLVWVGDGPFPTNVSIHEFPWEDSSISVTTFEVFEHLIAKIIKTHSYISDQELPDLALAKEWFYEHLYSLSQDQFIVSFWKEGFEAVRNFYSQGWRKWIQKCENMGCEFRWQTIHESRRHILKIELKRKPHSPLEALEFHATKRPNFTLLPFKLAEMIHDPSYLSRKYCALIARSGYVLASVPDNEGKPTENKTSWEEFYQYLYTLRPQGLADCSIFIWSAQKEQEMKLDQFTKVPNSFVPLSLNIPTNGGSTIEIPLKKTVVYKTYLTLKWGIVKLAVWMSLSSKVTFYTKRLT